MFQQNGILIHKIDGPSSIKLERGQIGHWEREYFSRCSMTLKALEAFGDYRANLLLGMRDGQRAPYQTNKQ